MKTYWIAITLGVLFAATSGATEIPLAFFEKFYPASLTSTVAGPVPLARRKTVFVPGPLDSGASPIAVAVFTNGVRAAVSVISTVDEGVVLATIAPDNMIGTSAGLALLDFDNSGDRKVIVTMSQSRGLSTTWIFKWTGAALQNIGPGTGTAEDYDTDLADVTFADLDGTGRMSIIDRHTGLSTTEDGTSEPHEQLRVFHYVNGSFEENTTVPDFMRAFARGTGDPQKETATFDVADTTRAREIVILNHNSSVSKAEVKLNGQNIAVDNDFNQTAIIRRTTGVQAHNVISVKLNLSLNGALTILVVPKP